MLASGRERMSFRAQVEEIVGRVGDGTFGERDAGFGRACEVPGSSFWGGVSVCC